MPLFGSWFGPFGGGTARGEERIEVDGGVFGSVLEAQRNLLFTQTGLGLGAIRGEAARAQQSFDSGAQRAADALQVARDTGFVFAELAAYFREGELIRVIEPQAFAVAGIEHVESGLQRTCK